MRSERVSIFSGVKFALSATKLTTTEYRQQIAMAISDGVQRHWEAARRDEPTLTLAAAQPE
jgi:hypothetical protein